MSTAEVVAGAAVLLLVVALGLGVASRARHRSRRLQVARRTDDDVLREQVLERLAHLTAQWHETDGSEDEGDDSDQVDRRRRAAS